MRTTTLRKQFSKLFFSTTAIVFFSGFTISAQSDSLAPAQAVVVTANPPAVITVVTPTSEVTGVVSNGDLPNEAGLADQLTVNISNLETLLSQAKDLNSKVILYINDIPVKDAISERTSGGISFLLRNEGDVTDVWDLMMSSRAKGQFFTKKVSITVGIDGQDPLPTKVDGKNKNTFTLILVHKTWFYISILSLIALFILFIVMAKNSDMLRDTGLVPAGARKPFSLARVQMATWFFVVLASWLLLYLCLHRFNLISESILVLMGITAGTGVGGLALDTNKAKTVTTPSEGLLKDLISDHSNISLFRFQNMAWTLVLVVVFIRSVIVYMKMPEFDNTLLLLMGVSSGTYLGAKVTEKKEDAPETDIPAADTATQKSE